jgi:hypothetical protein
MRNRRSHGEASAAAPKMMGFSWYVNRRPYRSPRKPVRSAPNVIPTNVIEMKRPFCAKVEKPVLYVAPSTLTAM